MTPLTANTPVEIRYEHESVTTMPGVVRDARHTHKTQARCRFFLGKTQSNEVAASGERTLAQASA